MVKRISKAFFGIYSFLLVLSVLCILLGKVYSTSGFIDFILSNGVTSIFDNFRYYAGQFTDTLSNLESFSDFIDLLVYGFLGLINAIYFPIQVVISVLGYFVV